MSITPTGAATSPEPLIDHPAGKLSKGLRMIAVGGAAAYILLYIGLAFVRMRYPFELEWMEGSVVEHVRRAVAGKPIYGPPSIDFVPYLYPPLYYYVSAVVALVTGVGLFPLRLVSFAASLGACAFIFSLVRRETNDRAAGILAVGLFAATFRASGAWFDIARVDSLFLVLLLAAAYLARCGCSHRAAAAAGALLALSALTKQTALVIAPGLVLYALISDWRRGLTLGGTLIVVFASLTAALQVLHDGWYVFYVFELPGQIQDVGNASLRYWTNDLLRPMPVGLALSLGWLSTAAVRFRERKNLFYPIFCVTLVLASWITRAHSGAYDNVLIPAYAAIAIASGLALSRMTRALPGLSMFGFTFYLLQLAMLFYDPRAQLPTSTDRALGQQLVELIAKAPGDVYVPRHSSIAELAGKRSFAHSQAVADIVRGSDPQHSQPLMDEIGRAIREQRFQLIIVDRIDSWLGAEFDAKYVRVGPVFDRDGFWPVTGARTRPEWIYAPR